jgi:adenosylhomocysteine nucleosidase
VILILAAIESEARAVRRALPAGTEVRAIGIGAVHLPVTVEARVVVLCGLAGALNPDLRVGDLVLDDRHQMFDISDSRFEKIRRGRIHTAETIIATPAEKVALFQSTAADAVDMEQSIVMRWCESRRLPLIGLRAISDTATETLDPAVLGMVDDLGRPRPAKVAALLLRRPALIPEMTRLSRNSKIALDQLATGVRTIVDALPSV